MSAQLETETYQQLIVDLHDRLARAHAEKQRLLHDNERLREQLGAEVRAAKTGGYELEVHCDERDCVTLPIRITKAPPEDAIHLWVAGMGWQMRGDRYLCSKCKGRT